VTLATFPDLKLSIVDAVWIATALLQRADPGAIFSTDLIVQKIQSEELSQAKETSIRQHVTQHCVANRIAQPNTVCMLTALGKGNRRLFREGDTVEAGRNPNRTHPNPADIPPKYHDLIHWFKSEWFPRRHRNNANANSAEINDPLLTAAGTGRDIWKIDAVVYIQRLREEKDARV
jgi:hypothetical protein